MALPKDCLTGEHWVATKPRKPWVWNWDASFCYSASIERNHFYLPRRRRNKRSFLKQMARYLPLLENFLLTANGQSGSALEGDIKTPRLGKLTEDRFLPSSHLPICASKIKFSDALGL